MRLIIAAILGGIVMFAWAGFSHMVLGNSEASGLPPASEAAVIANLKTNVTAEGFYILPGMDMTKTPCRGNGGVDRQVPGGTNRDTRL